ncbi:MAG: export transporter permease LptF [Pseudomonadota bacterium]
MTFQRSFLQELRGLAGGVFSVLLTIVVTSALIRTLGRAASGRADSELALPLIALSSLTSLGILLGLTAYVAVLMALTRAWKDSEMVVWLASGQSLRHWLAPVARFTWPFAALVALFSFAVTPWSYQQVDLLRTQFETRSDEQRVSPGTFVESQSGRMVFFGEISEETGQSLGLVFLRVVRGQQEAVALAASGSLEKDAQDQAWLHLRNGTRTDLALDSLEVRTMSFDSYKVVSDRAPPTVLTSLSLKAAQLPALWEEVGRGSLPAMGELATRLGLPLLCLVMPLLAIPLAVTNPRLGRSFHLLFGLLAYVLVSNAMTLSHAWIAQGRISFLMGWWLIPMAILVLTLGLIWFRQGLIRGPTEWVWLQVRRLRQG